MNNTFISIPEIMKKAEYHRFNNFVQIFKEFPVQRFFEFNNDQISKNNYRKKLNKILLEKEQSNVIFSTQNKNYTKPSRMFRKRQEIPEFKSN